MLVYLVQAQASTRAIGNVGTSFRLSDYPGESVFKALFHRVLEDRVVTCMAQSVKTGEAVFWPFGSYDNKGKDGLKKIYSRTDKEVSVGRMLDSSKISDLPHV